MCKDFLVKICIYFFGKVLGYKEINIIVLLVFGRIDLFIVYEINNCVKYFKCIFFWGNVFCEFF